MTYDLIIKFYFRCTQLDFANNNVSVKLQIAISFTSYILKQFQELAVISDPKGKLNDYT